MKYRIKEIDMIGYFAQVKRGLFSGWKTIGKHNNGVGEYDEEHLDYPLRTQAEAVTLAHAHADYFKVKKGFTHYRDMML
jgi:hypothetical protein